MGAEAGGAGGVKVDPAIAHAASHLAAWVKEQCRMREIVRRPYAVIGGEVLPLTDVVYHQPEAMR